MWVVMKIFAGMHRTRTTPHPSPMSTETSGDATPSSLDQKKETSYDDTSPNLLAEVSRLSVKMDEQIMDKQIMDKEVVSKTGKNEEPVRSCPSHRDVLINLLHDQLLKFEEQYKRNIDEFQTIRIQYLLATQELSGLKVILEKVNVRLGIRFLLSDFLTPSSRLKRITRSC